MSERWYGSLGIFKMVIWKLGDLSNGDMEAWGIVKMVMWKLGE